tara:strand:+ start:203 stop:454 length:252 start_codon:yes stop_codon:yes gene_type:complete
VPDVIITVHIRGASPYISALRLACLLLCWQFFPVTAAGTALVINLARFVSPCFVVSLYQPVYGSFHLVKYKPVARVDLENVAA